MVASGVLWGKISSRCRAKGTEKLEAIHCSDGSGMSTNAAAYWAAFTWTSQLFHSVWSQSKAISFMLPMVVL